MPTREDSDKAQGLLTAAGGVERHLYEVIPSAARAPEFTLIVIRRPNISHI